MNLTYAPHRLSLTGQVKDWRVIDHNGTIVTVFAAENEARHYCGLPPVPGGDRSWPDRLVYGPAGDTNPINQTDRIEPAEGQTRVGGAAAMFDVLSGSGLTAEAEDATTLMHRHGLGLALLGADAAPLLGYRVTGLPNGAGALLLRDSAGLWHPLPSPFDQILPASSLFVDACHLLLGYIGDMPQNAQIRPVSAPETAGPENREIPPAGKNPGVASASERIASALERIADAFGTLDSKGMSHMDRLAWAVEALVQQRR